MSSSKVLPALAQSPLDGIGVPQAHQRPGILRVFLEDGLEGLDGRLGVPGRKCKVGQHEPRLEPSGAELDRLGDLGLRLLHVAIAELGKPQVVVPGGRLGVVLQVALQQRDGFRELVFRHVDLGLEKNALVTLRVDLLDLLDGLRGLVDLALGQVVLGQLNQGRNAVGLAVGGLFVALEGLVALVPGRVEIAQVDQGGGLLRGHFRSLDELLLGILHALLQDVEVSEGNPGRRFLAGDLRRLEIGLLGLLRLSRACVEACQGQAGLDGVGLGRDGGLVGLLGLGQVLVQDIKTGQLQVGLRLLRVGLDGLGGLGDGLGELPVTEIDHAHELVTLGVFRVLLEDDPGLLAGLIRLPGHEEEASQLNPGIDGARVELDCLVECRISLTGFARPQMGHS